MRTSKVEGYRPSDAQDVTSELAAFNARGMNGSVRPRDVSEMMRRELPKSTGRAVVDVEAFFRDGQLDSTALEQALKAREAEERAENERKTREAEAEYEATLAAHRERLKLQGLSEPLPTDDEIEIDWPTKEEIVESTKPSKTARLDALKPLTTGPKPAGSPIVMREIADEDVDRLWDWLRVDPQPNGAFFKTQFRSSRELFSYVANALGSQVPIRAIEHDGRHVGFFALWPISTTDRTALLHIYIDPAFRGPRFVSYFPYILTGARKLIPATMQLVMHAQDHVEAFDRLLRSYNFTPHVMFVQPGANVETQPEKRHG